MHGKAITLFIMNKHTFKLTHLLWTDDHTYTLELSKQCVSSHYLLLQRQQELTVKLVQEGKKNSLSCINCL